MDFGKTLLAAQRNQQQKSSRENVYYRTKFEPPKKEAKPASRLSANIQKFLAKKEEEERRKQEEARRKRDELLSMRDPKATKKIQKMLKVIKSANKSVLEEAVDREHTAVTRAGAEQPDHDDYGYESQEAAAIYRKMMDKYSKLPDEEKFPSALKTTKKDLEGTRERMKAALQREDEPQPRQRKSKIHQEEKEPTPPPQPEKKPEKQKIRRPAPPPIDFNQLLKLAEKKKDEPIALPSAKKQDGEPERPLTKRQRREMEEERARREARRLRLAEAEGKASVTKHDTPRGGAEKKSEPTFTRIPKIGDKQASNSRPSISKPTQQVPAKKISSDPTKHIKQDTRKMEHVSSNKINTKTDSLKHKFKNDIDKSKLLKEHERNTSKEYSKNCARRAIEDKPKNKEDKSNGIKIGSSSKPLSKEEHARKIEMMEKMLAKEKALLYSSMNGSSKSRLNSKSKVKDRPRESQIQPAKSTSSEKKLPGNSSDKPKPGVSKTFDFDAHVNSLKKDSTATSSNKFPPADVRRKHPHAEPAKNTVVKRRAANYDSEYDSEMDDFIDDGDEEVNVSAAIRDIFGYDRNKYRDVEDDDAVMESSFAQQMREEYISKKIGIMEDLEDMRMEAMEKKRTKKRRRISDDDE